MAGASLTGCDPQGTVIKNLLATEVRHGTQSVAVIENTHVTGAGHMMSHVIGRGNQEERFPQAEDRDTLRTREGVGISCV